MASLKADYTMGKVEAVADLGFGRRAEEFSYNDAGTLAAIKQAYVSYSPSDKVKFTMGKWFTHVGYEVPDAYLNRNYSMDYMFSYGPFSHTGVKMEVTPSSIFGFMIGIANPTDFTSASFAKKNFLAQIHLASTVYQGQWIFELYWRKRPVGCYGQSSGRCYLRDYFQQIQSRLQWFCKICKTRWR